MEIKLNVELPFSWCRFCNQRTLRTKKMMADGEVYDSQTICENAPICEACEKAREEEQGAAEAQPTEESERQRRAKVAAAVQEGFEAGLKIVIEDKAGRTVCGKKMKTQEKITYRCQRCQDRVETDIYAKTKTGSYLLICPACGGLTVLPEKKRDKEK